MKIRTLILVFLLMAVLIFTGSCATGKKAYVVKDNEELYGTWVNPDYNDKEFHAKIVFNPNGKADLYPKDTSTNSIVYFEFSITDKWTDSEGNVWYKFSLKDSLMTVQHHVLSKISNSGNTLEIAIGYDYPEEVDPNGPWYEIRYRQ